MRSDKEPKRSVPLAILRGILTAAAVTAAAFVITAAVMTFGSISESGINKIVYITGIAAVLSGSIVSAAALKKRGLVNGIAVGLIYVLLMIIVGYIITPDFSLSLKTLITLAAAAAGGAIGGIIGVNLTK